MNTENKKLLKEIKSIRKSFKEIEKILKEENSEEPNLDLRYPSGVPSEHTHSLIAISRDTYFHAYLSIDDDLCIYYHNKSTNELIEADSIRMGDDYSAIVNQMAHNWFELNAQ